ncbi:MAG TPA: O-antigen ligase family protein [Pyrinomonadaceae bacterium]
MTWANKLAFFLICAIVILTTLAYGTVHQPIIAVFYSAVATLPILWAIDGFSSGRLRYSTNLLQLPLVAAAIYGFVQIVPFGSLAETAGVSDIPRTISLDPFATQVSAIHFIALAMFFAALLVFTDSAKRLQKLVYVITIFGFVYAFFAILQSVLSPNKIYGIYESRFGSPFGSFVNRHNFAAFMEMALSLPLGLMFVGAIKKDKRLLYVTAIGLMGVALLLSGSRGAFVALLAQIIFLVILTTKTRGGGQIALKVGLAFALVAGIVAGSFFVGGESSLTRFAETAASNDITTDRAHIWSITLSVIANNLPFGAGLGAFAIAYTPFDSMSGLARVEQAHNDYLQVLADAGIVGLIIGAFFVFWLFRQGIRHSKTGNTFRRGVVVGALAGCFAILVHSVFDFVLHTTAISVLFLTLVSLVVSGGSDYADDIETFDSNRLKKRRAASVTPIEDARRKVRGEN